MTVTVGQPAPGFTLKDQNNQAVSLADCHGRCPTLLVFYPLAFTGVCRGELDELQRTLAEYERARVRVMAVSVDSVFSHKVFAMAQGYDFTQLADFWPHGAVANAYGVLDATTGVAERGTFLIDRDGIVRFAECGDRGRARDQTRWREAVARL